MSKVKNIGLEGVEAPAKTCEDTQCPWHGSLPVRGRILEGVVVSDNMTRAVVIRRDFLHLVRKYNRYERRKGLITARLPDCIDVKEGDVVKAVECRPLAKSISFVVVQKGVVS
ncbi:MAG: 30S ribosomal protein S17 [Candidatus Kariarchaeaceae archaeon]|jgi:small subunit ribosomal protein S17